MKNYLDGWLHAVGVATVNTVSPDSKDETMMKVDVMFMGGELLLTVPRRFVVDDKGVPIFGRDDDTAWVDLRLGVTSNAKSFDGNTYTRTDITVKKVVEFRRLTAEESKAM